MNLTEKDRQIIAELIVNPRISDNKLSRLTKIPTKTVNRRRKQLEENGLLYYFTLFNNNIIGQNLPGARSIFIVKFKEGITLQDYMQNFLVSGEMFYPNAQFIFESAIGEMDGRLALIIFMVGKSYTELNEFFNGKIVRDLQKKFGENCIVGIDTMRINFPIRLMFNYLPFFNIGKDGRIKPEFKREDIFVDKTTFILGQQKK